MTYHVFSGTLNLNQSINPRTLDHHVYRTLLSSDGSRGSPIVYSLGLHTPQTTMIAINGATVDLCGVRNQPSHRWL